MIIKLKKIAIISLFIITICLISVSSVSATDINIENNIDTVDLTPENITIGPSDNISNNIVYGDTVMIIVNLEDNASGLVGFSVDNKNWVNATIESGKANATFDGLSSNNYTAYIKYGEVTYSKNFTVNKAKATITVDCNNITYGESRGRCIITTNVNISKPTRGYVYFYINNIVSSTLLSNQVKFTYPLNIKAGYYNAFVKVDCNNYEFNVVETGFEVRKAKVSMDVNICSDRNTTEIVHGDKVIITVNVPKGDVAQVSFKLINSSSFIKLVDVINGTATYSFDNLDIGEYTVDISYLGNNYFSDTVHKTFTISPLNTAINVNPVKGNAGEKVKIDVKVIDDNSNPVKEGTVIIRFNGKEYKANVVNGIATIEIVLPKSGTYSATAYYKGFNYNSSYKTFTVEVSDIPNSNTNPNLVNNCEGNMENTGNPLLVLLIALGVIGIESLKRKF